MKKALIVGATGFGGLGLIEILLRHKGFQIAQLVARKDVGKKISEVFPHLEGFCDMPVQSPEEINYDDIDIAFFSTPDKAGMQMIHTFYKKNIPVIDFSGDFRFATVDDYTIYAKNKGMNTEHASSDVLAHTVYGLPEKYAEKIKKAKIVGNPGCFAIAMILGLLPAVETGIIDSETIICDGKTGVSGAGKNPGEANFYPQRYEDVNTYREGHHQHIVEVENIVNAHSKKKHKILFIPQIVPLNRGILVTIYADVQSTITSDELFEMYTSYYTHKPFIHITHRSCHTTDVRGTNRCQIRPSIDSRTGKLFITSVIDNLIKGQSGNAVQNANLIMGFDETEGLMVPAFYP
ncbi:MAG: N-acetyl-gamma-glutamyl-phosphate reductase [Spirochaetes bacterium]|nr:N-acetyl-gamma-glutamyl-phosphate reductase [Spirochaetota bacterium]